MKDEKPKGHWGSFWSQFGCFSALFSWGAILTGAWKTFPYALQIAFLVVFPLLGTTIGGLEKENPYRKAGCIFILAYLLIMISIASFFNSLFPGSESGRMMGH